MQIRCYKCHTPFDFKKDEIHAALNEITTEGHKYYNVHCPRCRRANKLPKKQLRRWAPTWVPSQKPAGAKSKVEKKVVKPKAAKTPASAVKVKSSKAKTTKVKSKAAGDKKPTSVKTKSAKTKTKKAQSKTTKTKSTKKKTTKAKSKAKK